MLVSRDPELPPRPETRSEAEAHLRRLFRLSLDLMCVANFEGYFTRVNPAFEQVLGYDADELLSRRFIEFVHPDDHESTIKEVENLSSGAVVVDFENRYRTKSGDYRWLAWRSAPMVDSRLIYAVARDITRIKRDRELLDQQARELERSNADLERFAHVASHDLRAPLRSIVTLAGFIEHDLGDAIPPKTREHLAELGRRALLMKALTDDLLVYSQAGDGREEIVGVECAELVKSIAFLLDPPESFTIEADASLPAFMTLRGPLEQVLRNLIANAVMHHDRDDGTVTVSARDAGDTWQFAVADDGPGIDAEDQARVQRALDQRHTESARGSWGMGLGLVSRIVGRFGGRVSFDTSRQGGAEFSFDWPKQIADKPSAES